jgi:hypothetical protein
MLERVANGSKLSLLQKALDQKQGRHDFGRLPIRDDVAFSHHRAVAVPHPQ